MAGIDRPKFRPTASPVNTVAADTTFNRLPEPVNTFVKPIAPQEPVRPTPPPKSNVDQLIQSLAALNPTLNRFMGQYFEEVNKQDALDAEVKYWQDNSPLSWGEAVKRDPTLADRSPVFRQVYESRIAKTAVQRRAGELIAKYWTSGLANSEDPTAIIGWLQENFKDLLDSVESPAAKQAMIEEIQSISAQFIQNHRENARGNLVRKNMESVSTSIQTMFDGYQAMGPAAPYQTDDPVILQSMQGSGDPRAAMKAAFLNAIAGGESSNKYNIRYTPNGGALFSDFSRHPRIFEPGPEGPSSAAGRYQFTWSTWKAVMGEDTPFTPENQDKAALKYAEMVYQERTGRSLWDDMEKEGFSPRIQAVLSNTWAALRSNKGRHLATYNASLQKYGGTPTGPGAQNAYIPEITEEIHKIEYQAKAQGVSGQALNKLVVAAIVNSAIYHQDESLLEIAMQKRPDGSPGPGMTVEGRAQIEEARKQIRSLKIQEANHQWTLEQRQREVRKDQVVQTAAAALLGQMKAGQPPRIPLDILEQANKEHPDIYRALVDTQKNLDDVHKVEDPLAVAQLTARVFSNEATQSDVMDAIEKGILKSHGTIQSLLEFAGRRGTDNPLNVPGMEPIIESIKTSIGRKDGLSAILQDPTAASHALTYLAETLMALKREKPNVSPAEILAKAREVQKEMFQLYRPDIDFEGKSIEAMRQKAQGTSAVTAPTPNGSKQIEAPAITPRAGVEWRKVPLYGSVEQLVQEAEQATKGNVVNNFALWVIRLGLTSKEQVQEFLDTQKRLIQQQSSTTER